MEDGVLASEGFPHSTPVCRVVDVRSLPMGVSCTGGLEVVMGHWLVDSGGGGGALTKLRFRGLGDPVEVEGHRVGGWGSTASQARPLMGTVWREGCKFSGHSRNLSSMCLFITSVFLVLIQRLLLSP